MFWHFRCVAGLLLLILSGSASAQQNAAVQLDAYLDGAHKSGAFNGNMLVAEHGRVVLRRAVGDADAKGTPLTLDDRFHIGSVAKEFDAVGLLMLAEQKRLSLNDPVAKFFPDLPPWAQSITLDHLLHYTSGLPEVDWKTVHSDAENWRNLHALEHLDFAPGSQYAYTNNNTFLRRKVIEKVTGGDFKDFVVKHEFPPAGILHGVVDPIDSDSAVARSLDGNGKQDSLGAPISGWTALTVDDLYHWSECIRRFCLISPASTAAIASTTDPNRQTGFGHLEMSGKQVASHSHDGSALHYQALLTFEAAKDRTIILLTNQRKGPLHELAEGIEGILDRDANALRK